MTTPSKRKHRLVLIAALAVAISLAASSLRAEDAARIYFIGNSLTDQIQYDRFAELAAAGGVPIVWGRTMIPGAPIYYLWSQPGRGFGQAPFGTWDKALRNYEWDVLTLQVGNNPDFAGQFKAADQFRRLALEKSPRLAVYVYATWPGRQRGAAWDRSFLETDPRINAKAGAPFDFQGWVEKMPAELREHYRPTSSRNRAEVQVRGMRQLLPDAPPVKLIPAAHAMLLLNQKMRAGRVPGLTSVYDLYSDGLHLNNAGSYLVALTFYATIFGKNPVGLPSGGYQARAGHPEFCVPITPELARAFQETVWEVVATHPLTGVSANDPLKVASPLLDSAVVGEPYRFELLPAFGKAPHVWSLAKGKLPEGLTLTESGAITGTPTTAGNSELTLALTDAAGGKATASFTLKVEAPVNPVIPAQSIGAMSVGQFMEQTLRSEGGNGICLWRVKQGSALPPGLTLDGYGRLWGAPGKEGRYEFTLEVVDGKTMKPGLAERAFTATVGPAVGEVALARRLSEKLKLKEEVDPSPWNFRYPIRKLVQGDQATVSGAFDLAWDDDSLWVAVRVKDATNHPGVNWSPKFQGDNIVICLDGYNNREATYNADDRYLAYPRKSPYALPFSIGHPGTVGCRQKELEDGYFVLFQVGFRNFGWTAETLSNRVIGLDLVLVDDAKDGAPKSTVVWQGTKNNATDPSKFGTVILQEHE